MANPKGLFSWSLTESQPLLFLPKILGVSRKADAWQMFSQALTSMIVDEVE